MRCSPLLDNAGLIGQLAAALSRKAAF